MTQGNEPDRVVSIGQVRGVYGVQGGLKVYSYTQPRERIFSYQPWLMQIKDSWVTHKLRSGPSKGKGLVAYLEGITDADQARGLLGVTIAITRAQLPVLPAGEYYWCDLIQLELIDIQGKCLGKIVEMRETGANDVMVVEGDQRFLVPWVMKTIVKQVDLSAGRVYVDWNPEYQ